jgi:hypothetical protein
MKTSSLSFSSHRINKTCKALLFEACTEGNIKKIVDWLVFHNAVCCSLLFPVCCHCCSCCYVVTKPNTQPCILARLLAEACTIALQEEQVHVIHFFVEHDLIDMDSFIFVSDDCSTTTTQIPLLCFLAAHTNMVDQIKHFCFTRMDNKRKVFAHEEHVRTLFTVACRNANIDMIYMFLDMFDNVEFVFFDKLTRALEDYLMRNIEKPRSNSLDFYSLVKVNEENLYMNAIVYECIFSKIGRLNMDPNERGVFLKQCILNYRYDDMDEHLRIVFRFLQEYYMAWWSTWQIDATYQDLDVDYVDNRDENDNHIIKIDWWRAWRYEMANVLKWIAEQSTDHSKVITAMIHHGQANLLDISFESIILSGHQHNIESLALNGIDMSPAIPHALHDLAIPSTLQWLLENTEIDIHYDDDAALKLCASKMYDMRYEYECLTASDMFFKNKHFKNTVLLMQHGAGANAHWVLSDQQYNLLLSMFFAQEMEAIRMVVSVLDAAFVPLVKNGTLEYKQYDLSTSFSLTVLQQIVLRSIEIIYSLLQETMVITEQKVK